jgi:hypothetical protein
MTSSNDVILKFFSVRRGSPTSMQEVRVTFAAPQDRRLHADTTAIQAEGAIGGEVCLYLGRARTELSQLLSKLRSNMQLLSFSTAAAAVSAEDSVALWTAWRETLFAAIEDCGMLALESDLDDGRATTQRRREAVERLETLQRSLATHALSLDEALVQLRNTEAKLRQTAAAATAAVTPPDRPSGAYTVSYNAAVAIDRDRRGATIKLREHAERERVLVTGVLAGLQRAVSSACTRHNRAVQTLRCSAADALSTAEATATTKRAELAARCQALRQRYEAEVHAPLLKLLGTAGSTTVAYETEVAALTAEVDPTCIARCTASLRELEQLRAGVERDASESVALEEAHDDPERRLARAQAAVSAIRTRCERTERFRALQIEEAAAQQALRSAHTRIAGLKRQATEAEWSYANAVTGLARSSGEHRKMTAALVTAARDRRSRIADELDKAEADITRCGDDLAAIELAMAETDRQGQLERRFSALEAVRVLCEQMRVAFAEVDQSDVALRRLMTAQLRQGIGESGTHAAAAVRRAVDLARTRLSAEMVGVRAIRDDALEMQRRVAELAAARAEQQVGIRGNEMTAYAALEELVAANDQLNDVLDARVRAEAMRQGCREAKAVTASVVRQLVVDGRQALT